MCAQAASRLTADTPQRKGWREKVSLLWDAGGRKQLAAVSRAAVAPLSECPGCSAYMVDYHLGQ